MHLAGLLVNRVLICALAAWATAQIVKLPVEYIRTGRWQWAWLLTTGGMPSSHSALIVGAANSIGLFIGYDSPLFALAVAIAMIVTYDAAGVRRQAGMHAERINVLFDELLKGHMWNDEELREVLGHTPFEVLGGTIWGMLVTTALWLLWR
ncbi:MAG: divergent PAP2 family protein [Chloroflexota bacterium]